MRILKMRQPLPDRRKSWIQEVTIGGQTIVMDVGEYDDGRPGEVFIDISKEGTFLRGVLGTLARMVSLSLQCGADVEVVCHALRGIDYPPAGEVRAANGDERAPSEVRECYSVTDWVASELELRYLKPQQTSKVAQGDVMPEKAAGYIPEGWRVGA